MTLEVPEPRDVFDVAMDDGAVLRLRRHGAGDADLRMYLSHGNGFAVDGYVPFWQPLADRFELIVFDFRNHGRIRACLVQCEWHAPVIASPGCRACFRAMRS